MLIREINTRCCGIKFNITLKDRLTLVGGDSGTGKTILYNGIQREALLSDNNNVVCINYNNIVNNDLDYLIKKSQNKLIIVDNADVVLNRLQRINISMDKNNQYIIFTHSIDGFKPSEGSIAILDIKNNKGKLKFPLLEA